MANKPVKCLLVYHHKDGIGTTQKYVWLKRDTKALSSNMVFVYNKIGMISGPWLIAETFSGKMKDGDIVTEIAPMKLDVHL